MIKVSNGLLKAGIDLRRVLFKSVLEAFGGNLEWVSCGGAAVDINIIKGFRDFGVNIINGYGITECSPVVSSNRPEYWVDGSVGVPLCCCEVKIDEPDNNGIGEILVKGETVILRLRDDCRHFDLREKVKKWTPDPEHPEKYIGIRMVLQMAKDIAYTNTMNTNNLIITI